MRIGTSVATAPAFTVKNAAGAPLAGVGVTFTVEAGGGSVAAASAVTDASGTARTGTWTLGTAPGENRLRAAVTSTPSISATVAATARLPHWTVMVYMAADNNLATSGLIDLEELESVAVSPEVQVAVQAEFNPTELLLRGCAPACFNRPNFNTFRYVLTGTQPKVLGPDGPVSDIGNRDMTAAAELTGFVSWAKQTAPAEHYLLVLWNHGGGYTGLLQDLTSAGSVAMSMSGLRDALTAAGSVDIIDFDMCLMGGYETLESIKGVTQYAVFSEEVVPGDGNPYETWLSAIQARAAGDPAEVAAALVDAFDASYQGGQPSTTRSAYSLSGYAEFATSLNALAELLRTNVTGLRPAISVALSNAQKFEFPELTDLTTFLDSLAVHAADPSVQAAIDNVKNRAGAEGFRLRNRTRNGTAVGWGGANDVRRATGLHVVLPSGLGEDRFGSAGPRSFAAYQALYPGLPWTNFLQSWITGTAATSYSDQGTDPFQGFLVWDSASVRLEADVDLWVLEPNGNLYIPWLGTVTPNGTFTGESSENDTWYEGYLTNRFVENGRYKLYAALFQDPANHQPVFDIQYRSGFTDDLTSLYAPDYPRLSLQTSWLNDATPTFSEVEANAYTDLRYAAYLDYGPTGVSPLGVPGPSTGPSAAPRSAQPTPAQLERVRRALGARQKLRDPRQHVRAGVVSGLMDVVR